ncbi:MAG: SMP-30/gluconolactonase/LRE family protein [Candidatus Marinimicrobia bacterium]|nr:SMP-30/gluconolactonase/LRE family protein [Candidatus Neomarinimicrobiota bacterium]
MKNKTSSISIFLLLSVFLTGALFASPVSADVDDLIVDSGGNVYFSDATIPELRNDYYHDILIHRPFGRLLRFDPSSGDLKGLLDRLFFTNGVALSPDEDFVLVAETSQYQITRF